MSITPHDRASLRIDLNLVTGAMEHAICQAIYDRSGAIMDMVKSALADLTPEHVDELLRREIGQLVQRNVTEEVRRQAAHVVESTVADAVAPVAERIAKLLARSEP